MVLFEKICSIKSCHFSKSRNPDGLGKPDILHQIAKSRNPDGTVTKPDCFQFPQQNDRDQTKITGFNENP